MAASENPADEAIKQMSEYSEKLASESKKIGNLLVDGFDQSWTSIAAFEKKIAGQITVPAVKSAVEAHADLVTQLTKSYTTVARGILA